MSTYISHKYLMRFIGLVHLLSLDFRTEYIHRCLIFAIIDYCIGKYGKCNHAAGGNLAASNIRNLECPSYEVYLIDYGCGKFNKKVHIME